MSFVAIAIGTTVVSTGLAIYGQSQAAGAARQAANYNNNLAQAEARNRELETAEAIKRERENNTAILSSMRNSMAGSGFVTTSDTPMLLQAETAGRLEIGIQDAARSARMQSDAMRAKGAMGIWEAKSMTNATNLNMLATGIAGAAKIGGILKPTPSLGLYPRVGNQY